MDWGSSNTFGVSGTGSQSLNGPVKVMDNVVNVWGENVGGAMVPSVFALTQDGSLYSWGVNNYNQLGYQGGNREYELSSALFGENAGTMPYQDTPRRVNISNVADVCNTNATTLILKTDGTIWAVGNNAPPTPCSRRKFSRWTPSPRCWRASCSPAIPRSRPVSPSSPTCPPPTGPARPLATPWSGATSPAPEREPSRRTVP